MTHGLTLQKNILITHLIQTVIILIVLTVRYVISLISAQHIRFLSRSLFYSFYFINVVSYIHHMWLYSLSIKCSGDIEENPGLKPNYCEYLFICHWNLNSISAHNFMKLSLLRAYISIKKNWYYMPFWNLLRLKYFIWQSQLGVTRVQFGTWR